MFKVLEKTKKNIKEIKIGDFIRLNKNTPFFDIKSGSKFTAKDGDLAIVSDKIDESIVTVFIKERIVQNVNLNHPNIEILDIKIPAFAQKNNKKVTKKKNENIVTKRSTKAKITKATKGKRNSSSGA